MQTTFLTESGRPVIVTVSSSSLGLQHHLEEATSKLLRARMREYPGDFAGNATDDTLISLLYNMYYCTLLSDETNGSEKCQCSIDCQERTFDGEPPSDWQCMDYCISADTDLLAYLPPYATMGFDPFTAGKRLNGQIYSNKCIKSNNPK